MSAAQELVDGADKEARNLTDDEREQVRTHTTKASEFQAKIKDAEDNDKLRKSIASLGQQLTSRIEEVENSGNAKSPGDAIVRSEGYKALVAAGFPSGDWRTGQIEYMGAAGDAVLESPAPTPTVTPPDWLPRLANSPR